MTSVNRIPTDRNDLYAFEIDGEVSGEDMESMSRLMNSAFDAQDGKVDMLLLFRDYEGSEAGASLDWDVVSSRFRSLAHVDRYVVINAPERAEKLIQTMAKLMPVEAHTFGMDEAAKAWHLLGARPLDAERDG